MKPWKVRTMEMLAEEDHLRQQIAKVRRMQRETRSYKVSMRLYGVIKYVSRRLEKVKA